MGETGPEYAAHVAIVKMNLAQVYGAEGRRLECAAMLEESLRDFGARWGSATSGRWRRSTSSAACT